MKFIFNNFIHLLNRFKTSALLNALGMSVAFAVFIVIAIQTYRDATFNHSFSKIDTIEYLTIRYPSDGREIQYLSYPVGERIDSVMPEIKNFCVLGNWGENLYNKGNQDRQTYNIKTMQASRGFLDIFTPEITRGSTVGLFENKESILISEETAKMVFGDEDPIGKQVYHHYGNNAYTIVAVYKDFPKNSTPENGIYTYLSQRDPSEWSYNIFFDLVPCTRAAVDQKLNSVDVWGEEAMAEMKTDPTMQREYFLSPLKDIFMDTPGNKASFLSLLGIGIIILLIAFINYLNFSIAMAPSRIKTINIHKILGIKGSFLRFTIRMEGVFTAFIAIILALFYIYVFSSSAMSAYFSADLSLSANVPLLIGIGIGLLILVNIVGVYPSRYITSFPEAIALNGSFALSPKGVRLRNVLITVQFTAAIFLICVATFIKIQYDYMQSYNWGIQKENIVYLSLNGLKTGYKTLGEEVIKNPDITDYTASRFVPGKVYMGWGRDFEGKYISIKAWPVLPNFLDFFGAKVTAGDNFTQSSGDSTKVDQIILNEKFLEKYDFNYDLIGKDFPGFRRSIIRGIAGNVNFESVRNPIEPMAFINFYDDMQIEHIFFKIQKGANISEAVGRIRQTWNEFSDDEAKLYFLDEEIDHLYTNEANMSKLISLFGFITIIIAVMGIYGLIVFNTRYKEKEIGVRKVNGATEMEIVYMLNKNLIFLLLIAFVIAVPVAYYTIGKWLENFAYKSAIPWWLFPAAGILVLIISVITISRQSWRAATANPVDALKNE